MYEKNSDCGAPDRGGSTDVQAKGERAVALANLPLAFLTRHCLAMADCIRPIRSMPQKLIPNE